MNRTLRRRRQQSQRMRISNYRNADSLSNYQQGLDDLILKIGQSRQPIDSGGKTGFSSFLNAAGQALGNTGNNVPTQPRMSRSRQLPYDKYTSGGMVNALPSPPRLSQNNTTNKKAKLPSSRSGTMSHLIGKY